MKNVLDLDLAIDPGPHQTHHYSVGRVFALLLFSGERVECQNKTFHFMTFRTRPTPPNVIECLWDFHSFVQFA